MSSSDKYNVFLSYHWRDQAHVEMIARWLQTKGIKVFLDRWYLISGRPWPQALEHILSSCGAVAVCIGPEEMGPWQQREKDVALDCQVHDPMLRRQITQLGCACGRTGIRVTEISGVPAYNPINGDMT